MNSMNSMNDIDNQVDNFKQSLNQECYSFGDGRGIRVACNLYEENLKLEKELQKSNMKLEAHKKEIDRLQEVITEGINEFSVNLVSDTLSRLTSAEIYGNACESSHKV